MRLIFDRGTIVLADEADQVDLASLPDVLWDARVGVYRVPPHRCSALLAELRTRGVQVSDETAPAVRKPDVVFSCPDLRDYQRTALEMWAVQAPLAPREVRRAVFDEMAKSGGSRADVLERIGQHLAIEPSALAAALFADLPGERIVLSPDTIPSPTDAIRRVNLAMAQAMLFRATSVRVRAEGGMRPLVRLAKLRGLICTVAVPPGNAAPCLELSGPYALFRRTLLYGRALAGIVPPLVASGRFSLTATCVVRGQALDFVLATGDPVSVPEQPRRYDSKLEERFAREFRKAAPEWDVIREPEPLRAGAGLIFPDFLLRHRQDPARKFLVFWTREYLEHKFATLRRASVDNLVICVDAERACSEGELPPGARVVRFKRKIDPAAVLALLTPNPNGLQLPR